MLGLLLPVALPSQQWRGVWALFFNALFRSPPSSLSVARRRAPLSACPAVPAVRAALRRTPRRSARSWTTPRRAAACLSSSSSSARRERRAVLCYAVLCCAVLCCAVPRSATAYTFAWGSAAFVCALPVGRAWAAPVLACLRLLRLLCLLCVLFAGAGPGSAVQQRPAPPPGPHGTHISHAPAHPSQPVLASPSPLLTSRPPICLPCAPGEPAGPSC